MTNYEKWLAYTDGLSSPDNFIQWGWIYTISSCLQRRVWIGNTNDKGHPSEDNCLFPNMPVILVGEPGVGKGLVIKSVTSLVKHWQRKDKTKDDFPAELAAMTELSQQAQIVQESGNEKAAATEYQGHAGKKGGEIIKPLLFPVAADATTFEALVEAVSESITTINYVKYKPDGTKTLGFYDHCSLCFLLPELSSLLRKRTNDTVNYLLGLYDCPLDFEYRTKNSGRDRVRRGCINLLAGTTPGFIQSTFDDSLLDEGFTSRTFFIYASKNRKNQAFIPVLTQQQLEHKAELLKHIKKLSGLYGQVKMGEGVVEFIEEWWNRVESNKKLRPNQSPKLIPYYARKNIHLLKVAMSIHFGESLDMILPLEAVKKALAILDKEELDMHKAIVIHQNETTKLMAKVLEALKSGKKDYVQLLCDCHGSYKTRKEMDDTLDLLITMEQIKSRSITTEDPEQTTIYWELI